MRKTLILLSCICCFLAGAVAQTCTPTWTTYSEAGPGFPFLGAVQDVAKDPAGNMWVTVGGNDGGLAKFDGTTWTTYNTSNSGLPGNSCFGVGADNAGNIWVGGFMNIAQFNGTTWTVHNSSVGFPNTQEVRNITPEGSDDIWVSTQSGLAYYNGTTWTTYNPTNSGISSYGIMDVAIDASGKKWIGTQGGGVSVFDGSTWTVYNTSNSGLPNNEAWAVGIHPVTGDKWFGTLGGGVCKYNGTTWTVYNTSNSGLIHNNIRGISFDGAGNIIFGSAAGVSVFDGNGSWTNYTPGNSPLLSSYIMNSATDTQGDVWLVGAGAFGASVYRHCPPVLCQSDTTRITEATCSNLLPYIWNGHTINAGGIGADTLHLQNAAGCDSLVILDLLVDQPSWTTYTGDNGLIGPNSVAGIAFDDAGHTWLSSSNNGISKFDGTNWTYYSAANSGLPNDNCFGLTVDNTGNLWAGTFLNISKFDGTTWTTYNTSNSAYNGSQEVRAIKADAANNIWAATQAGLAMFNGSVWTNYTSLNSGLLSTGIMDIEIDATGNKWLGTQGGGLSMYNGGTWTNYTTSNSGIASDQVFAVAIDASGKKWCGTSGGGLSVFDGANWTTYNTSNSGLVSNNVRSIDIDDNGKIWIGTANSGVSVFDGTTWTTYNTSNSALLSTFFYVTAKDPQGRMWLGGFENVNFTGSVTVVSSPCDVCETDTVTVTEHICATDLPYTWNGHVITDFGAGVDTLILQNAGGCDSLVVLDLLPAGSTWNTYVPANSGLSNNNVRSVEIDLDGNKWLGTLGSGVFRFDGTNWANFNSTNGGVGNAISDGAITVESNGNVWVGTQGTGAQMYDGTTWTTYTTSNSGIGSVNITGVAIDQLGNKWFAAYGLGVSKFDGTNWTTYPGVGNSSPECIATDASNRVWAGFGYMSGAAMYNGTTWTYFTTSNSGIANNGVNGIAQAPNGDMWFATANGVSRYTGTAWTTYNTSNSALVADYTMDIAVGASGNVWVATSGGVSMFDGTTWYAYNSANSGLLTNICSDVAVGYTPEEVWVSHHGIGGASSFTSPCTPTCVPTAGVDVKSACGPFTWIDGNTYTADNNTATYVMVGGNAGGCDSTVTLDLTIHAVPSLSTAGTVSACNSINLTSVAVTDANNTGATYGWYSNAACTVPVANPASVTVSGTYYVVGSSASCSDTVNTTVTVTPAPSLSVTGTLGGCGSVSLATVAITDANNTGATYSWFTDAACTVPVTNTANVTVSGTYYVVGISGSCSDTTNINASVNAAPVLSASAINSCGSVNLTTATITDANNTGATYGWFTDAACTTPVATPANVTVSGTYYVVGVSAPCSDTLAVNVTVSTTLNTSVSILADDFSVCTGDNVTFTATLTNGGSNPTYQWYKNTTPVGTNTNTYASNSLTSSDQIYVRVTPAEPCASPVVAESNHINILVGAIVTPQVTIIVSPGNIVAPGQQVTFTATTNISGGTPTFTWLKNGTPIPGATTSATYVTTGLANNDIIRCILHSNATCATPDTALSNPLQMTVTTAGIDAETINASVNVFPNPTNGIVNISIHTETGYQNAAIRLVDVSGKTVFMEQRNIAAGEQLFSIETSVLPAGIYQLQITSNNAVVAAKKLMVIK